MTDARMGEVDKNFANPGLGGLYLHDLGGEATWVIVHEGFVPDGDFDRTHLEFIAPCNGVDIEYSGGYVSLRDVFCRPGQKSDSEKRVRRRSNESQATLATLK